jgi:hypothetical protein
MHQRHFLRAFATSLLVATSAATACSDSQLGVTNPNQPDIARVFKTARDVETMVSKIFQQLYNGQYGSPDDIWTQTMTMSFESHSQLGNFGMGTRALIPRQPIDNSIGNNVSNGNFRDFDFLTRNARGASDAIEALDAFIAANNGTGTPQRDARAKAFAYFNIGYAMGMLSMLYDSAAVIFPKVPVLPPAPLAAYGAVNAAALRALDSAIALGNQATGQTIPAAWLSTPTGTTVPIANFIGLARSMKARFRAGVARTPAERAAVDWTAVVADASAGITSDFAVQVGPTIGWSAAVVSQLAVSSGWSQMTPFILGMADTSGGYQAWLAMPLVSRAPFLLKTPDLRFPSGETRTAQIAASGGTTRGGTPPGSVLYFRARPAGEDTPAEPWGTWWYDNHRFWAIRAAGGNGQFAVFTVAENDMLAAEGLIRTNNFVAAGPLIDKYRTRAGLPPVAGLSDLLTPVPGGLVACVPKVPVGPTFTTTACGNILEAMKWEKRVETSFTGYAQWFIDSRGWGDLVQLTALDWPVPYQELFARQRGSYTTTRKAAVGTYGF